MEREAVTMTVPKCAVGGRLWFRRWSESSTYQRVGGSICRCVLGRDTEPQIAPDGCTVAFQGCVAPDEQVAPFYWPPPMTPCANGCLLTLQRFEWSLRFFLFHDGRQPALRCITATCYSDFTQHRYWILKHRGYHHTVVVKTPSLSTGVRLSLSSTATHANHNWTQQVQAHSQEAVERHYGKL